MTRRAITVLALVCAVSVGVPALASAASGTPSQAISDCNDHGHLTQQYSTAVLRQALAQMPADVREYTDCFDVIERQLFAQVGTSTAGTTTGAPASSSSSGLPTWLIVVIVLLALAAITFGALAYRRRGAAAEAAGPGGEAGEPGDAPGSDPGQGPAPGQGSGPPGPGDAEGPRGPGAPPAG